MKTVRFILPAHWASALVNNDVSGLTPSDKLAIHLWLTRTDSLRGGDCLSCSENEFFTSHHDAKSEALPATCLVFLFPAPAEISA